jgi:hypothetical protein
VIAGLTRPSLRAGRARLRSRPSWPGARPRPRHPLGPLALAPRRALEASLFHPLALALALTLAEESPRPTRARI